MIQDKFYISLIKNYIRKNILVYDKVSALSPRESSYLKNNLNKNDYDNFLNYLREISIICKINNESNFMTDLINHLVKSLCEGALMNQNNQLNENKIFNNYHTISNNCSTSKFFI